MSSVDPLLEREEDKLERKLDVLEDRMDRFEENIEFLRELLLHIKSQFSEFRKDIEKNKK